MQSQCCISSRFESFINRFSHRNLCVALRSTASRQNHVGTEETGEKIHLYFKCDFWAVEQHWSRGPGRMCHLHPWRFTRADRMKLWATWSGLTADPAFSRRSDLSLPAVPSQPSWDCVTWGLTQNHITIFTQPQFREDILILPLPRAHGVLLHPQTSC